MASSGPRPEPVTQLTKTHALGGRATWPTSQRTWPALPVFALTTAPDGQGASNGCSPVEQEARARRRRVSLRGLPGRRCARKAAPRVRTPAREGQGQDRDVEQILALPPQLHPQPLSESGPPPVAPSCTARTCEAAGPSKSSVIVG